MQMEKFADVLIGDEIFKKRFPIGSVSYKWIDACIDKGELCDIEDHKLHPAPSGRPGVAPAGPKTTRAKFTPEEDKLLVRWVVQQQAVGQSSKGNKIYDLLADKYPSHTSQSWRDRWVKQFSHLPEESLRSYLDTADPPSSPPAQQTDLPRQSAAPSVPPPGSRPRVPPVSQSPPQRVAPRKRVPFSGEDDEILLEYVAQQVAAGRSDLGNKIYQELEEEVIMTHYQPIHHSLRRFGILIVYSIRITATIPGSLGTSCSEQSSHQRLPENLSSHDP